VTQATTSQNESAALYLVWTVPEIARVIGRTERGTYHMLESGRVPGAKKVCGRWCLAPTVFYDAVAAA
jgi:hypothetical protein